MARRAWWSVTPALLLAAAAAAGERWRDSREPVQVERSEWLLAIGTDFNADGVVEYLRLREEVRDGGGETHRETLELDLLEPLPADAAHGIVIGQSRFRRVAAGTFRFDDLRTPLGRGPRPDKYPGALGVRFGMLSAVVLPAIRPSTGERVLVTLFNTERGAFRADLDESRFLSVAQPQARERFVDLVARSRPTGAGAVALGGPPGPPP